MNRAPFAAAVLGHHPRGARVHDFGLLPIFLATIRIRQTGAVHQHIVRFRIQELF